MSSTPRHSAVSTSASGDFPAKQGMYNPAFEKDACGLAMVATLRGEPGHDIIDLALTALRNLEHRGAIGSDAGTGDGAGILTQMPDAFLRAVVDFELPPVGQYAAGMIFLPLDDQARAAQKAGIEKIAASEGAVVLGWRSVPTAPEHLGKLAFDARPAFEQLFVACPTPDGAPVLSGIDLDRRIYRLSKRARRELDAYFVTLSSRTLGYKGMVTTLQLEPFYPDLQDERFASELAVVHSRYSTNTFPSWPLAQPLRMLAHNGEINTVNGNRNWMRARQSQLESELHRRPRSTAADLHRGRERLRLVRRGPRAAHAHRTQPPARDHDDGAGGLREAGRHRAEPARVLRLPLAADGAVGRPGRAHLHRRHPGRARRSTATACVRGAGPRRPTASSSSAARPACWTSPRSASSAAGACGPAGCSWSTPPRVGSSRTTRSSRASPISHPWQEWLDQGTVRLADLPEREHIVHPIASITRRQRTFGYTEEEVRILLTPMGQTGAEPLGAMGSDTPIAVLSERPRLLFDYFTQQFAQVTNPPLDAIREEVVTSLKLGLGPERNLLDWGPDHARSVTLDFPVIDNDELAKIQHIHRALPDRFSVTIRGLYHFDAGPAHDEGAHRRDVRRGRRGDRRRCRVHHPVRPRLEQGPCADPVAAAWSRRSTTTSSAGRTA